MQYMVTIGIKCVEEASLEVAIMTSRIKFKIIVINEKLVNSKLCHRNMEVFVRTDRIMLYKLFTLV